MLHSSLTWRDRLTLWTSAILLALIIAVGILGLVQLISLIRSATPQVDFGTYYLAGAILDSSNPNELFDRNRLELEAKKRGFAETGYGVPPYIYAPFLAVLMRPISRMPYPLAETSWLCFNIVIILLSIPPLLIWNAHKPPGIGICLAILLIVVLYTPGQSALILGQVSPLLLFSLSWAFGLLTHPDWAKHRATQIVAGWLIGLATITKLFALPLALFLLWKRRLQAAGWTVLSLVAYIAIGAIGGGLPNTIQFFSSLSSLYGGHVYHSWYYNQSFSAALVRWLGQSPLVPYLNLLWSGLVMAVTCAALVRSPQNGADDERFALEYGLVLTSSLLILPHVALNYYLVLLVPFSALWFSPGTSPRLRVVSVLGSMALICVHTISMASLVFEGLGRALPFGLMAVLLVWGGLVARVGWTSRPCALEVQR